MPFLLEKIGQAALYTIRGRGEKKQAAAPRPASSCYIRAGEARRIAPFSSFFISTNTQVNTKGTSSNTYYTNR